MAANGQNSSGQGAAARTAARLRLMLADYADASPEVRRQHMAEEIEKGMATLVPAEHKAFLEELAGTFPAWEAGVGAATAGAAKPAGDGESRAAVRSATDDRELNDPSFLVKRLCQLAPALSEEAKSAAVAQLRAAGIVPTPASTLWSAEQIAALRTKFQLGDQRAIDPARVLELLTMLVDFANGLHQLVGTAWRTIAPGTDIKHRAGSLQNAMGRFVAGDPGVGQPQVSAEVERLRQLVASLIAAVGDVGRQFATGYIARFAPSEIKASAMSEPGVFVGAEAKCWRKYIELWDTLDEASVEREIRDTIAKFAETLMKGLGR